MLFNSFSFLVFFPVVTTLYFILPQRLRWQFLLLASCFFYMAFIPAYILVLFFIIAIDYAAGILIENTYGRARKAYLALSITANLGVLVTFKYLNFFSQTLNQLGHWAHLQGELPVLSWILPLGLSFHTFQAMSYTIEVYRGNQRAERRFGIYALYVMFYPQLVAGPIERPQNLIHQFDEKHSFDYHRVTNGLKLMSWGMLKKVVIADRLAPFVSQVYDSPYAYQGFPLILATFFFAFQIYCDFSGYSDIAIGAAQVMGFKLMRNFDSPYFAQSTADFWRRWHVSLSSWFRDYVYIPLGGSRTSQPRIFFNLMIAFLLSGLWHGANWTFIVWGILNGIYVGVGRWSKPLRDRFNPWAGRESLPKLCTFAKIALTFSLICFSWIFFRAENLTDALYISTHLGAGIQDSLQDISGSVLLGQGPKDMFIVLFWLLALLVTDFLRMRFRLRELLSAQPFWLRWGIYYAIVVGILLLGRFGHDARQFIYFQF